MNDEQAKAAFSKQRRFLILTSLAVIAYYWLGFSIKGAQISGATVDIARIDHGIIALWVVWGWSLWRYSQRIYQSWPDAKLAMQLEAQAEDHRIALKAATREGYTRAKKEEWFGPDMKVLRLKATALSNPSNRTAAALLRTPEFGHSQSGGRVYADVHVSHEHYNSEGGSVTSSGHALRWEWSWLGTKVHVGRAWVAALVRLPSMTEYLTPFVLALVAAFGPLYDVHAHVAPAKSSAATHAVIPAAVAPPRPR